MPPSLIPQTRTPSAGTSAGPSGLSDVRRTEDDELRPYVLAGELGKGSFATVYRGYNEVCHLSSSWAPRSYARRLFGRLTPHCHSVPCLVYRSFHRHFGMCDDYPSTLGLTICLGVSMLTLLFQNSKEQVAIKTVSRSSLSSKLVDNLQSEIEILKSLSHRHITKLIDIVVCCRSLRYPNQLTLLKRAEKNIYLIMEYCSGGDLTNYIKKRGKVDTLEYIPSPGAAPIYFPHPKSGGLDEVVVRSFLRQLGMSSRKTWKFQTNIRQLGP